MNPKIIFDASALLALINQEHGAEVVEKHLPHAIMSSVNVAEAAAILKQIGMPIEEFKILINSLIPQIIPFSLEQAYLSAILQEQTKSFGLSLGDRACLSLGEMEQAVVLTADKIWLKLNLPIKIELIR